MKTLKDELLKALANNNETPEDIEYLAFEDNDGIRYAVYQTEDACKDFDKYRQDINDTLVDGHIKEEIEGRLPELQFFDKIPPVMMYTKDHIYFSINDHEEYVTWGDIYSIPRNPDPALEELGFDVI
jgi:hypothetical protein